MKKKKTDAERADEIVAAHAKKKRVYALKPLRNQEDPRHYVITEDEYTKLAEIGRIDVPIPTKHNPVIETNIKKPYWYISSHSSVEMEFPHDARFETKEAAFNFVVMVRKAYLAEIKRVPLNETATRYIVDKARSLGDRTKAVISDLHDLRNEKWSLLVLARECGIKDAEVYIDDTDVGEAIDDILKFEYNGHPFFSEACLYELIGKEDARTVLALLKRLLKSIGSEKTIEL